METLNTILEIVAHHYFEVARKEYYSIYCLLNSSLMKQSIFLPGVLESEL